MKIYIINIYKIIGKYIFHIYADYNDGIGSTKVKI